MARSTTPAGIGYKDKHDRNDEVFTPADSEFVAVTVESAVRGVHTELGRFSDLVAALLKRDKLDPASLADGQAAALINQADTLTRKAVNAVVETAKVSAFGVRVDAYGVVGNGVKDDTDAFHTAASAAATLGVPLVIPAGMSVGISSYKRLPEGLTMYTNGSVFQQLTPSVLRAPVIGLGPRSTVAGRLAVSTLGGDACQGVLISDAPDVTVDRIEVRANTPGAGSANIRDNGLRVINSPRFTADRVYVENYSWPVWVELSNGVELGWVEASSYAKAVHVDGCSNFRINGGHVYGTAPNSQYAPGYNGLLIEADESTTSIHVQDFTIEDAGEHGVRVSGPMVQREVYFQNCVAKNSGGSGFKVLGSLVADARYNTGVTFDNCKAIDSGSINQNCCGFLIQMAQHVTLINPEVRRLDKDYSAVEGIRVSGVKHLTISRATVMDTYKYAIRLDETCGDVSNVHIDGRVHTSSGQGVYLQNPGVVFRNINLDVFVENTTVGGSAFYAGKDTAPQDSGAWGGINKLRLTISESTPAESAINRNSSDAALGAFFAEVTGRRGGDPAFRGGSTWMDTRLNTFQVRRANVWETV